ncbi:hypothetical protein [Paenibacillus sp. N3.4]|uniref:hypothetical protein n=1 Tax=Paenibacillus sp. N3.4 TaxID=2603222 RepID=UPI0011CAF3DE|nr:hypothetical protein [Paenibacillus sp. N3.4]TXK74520.1 hypothetical protein FU659_29215 [Paenibacillus sp. N3.4]
MLKEILSQDPSLFIEDAKNYFMNFQTKLITGTIFYSMYEYENFMQIYRTNKNQYSNLLEAFVSLWANSLIDVEEWHNYYEPSYEFANDVITNFFLRDINEYTYRTGTTESLSNYINQSVQRRLDKVSIYRENNPLIQYDQAYPNSIPGIYVNRLIVDERNYTFSIGSGVLQAEELWFYDNWAGYKQILLETEDEYMFLIESI